MNAIIHLCFVVLSCKISFCHNTVISRKFQPLLPYSQHLPVISWANIIKKKVLFSERPSLLQLIIDEKFLQIKYIFQVITYVMFTCSNSRDVKASYSSNIWHPTTENSQQVTKINQHILLVSFTVFFFF